MADFIHPRVEPVIAQDRGILESFGMQVKRAEDGVCEVTADVPVHLVNAAGFGHGSIAYSLMDTACAYAIGSLEVRGVTVNGSVTYVRGARGGDKLRGQVQVMSRTRRTATLRGEVFIEGEEGPQLAAHGSFVFQLIEVRT